jgi:hypothetical protein
MRSHVGRSGEGLTYWKFGGVHPLRMRISERALATSPAKEHPIATRLPASQRTREEPMVKLATRLIVEEALEGEAADAVGRYYYEHGAQPGCLSMNSTCPVRRFVAEMSSASIHAMYLPRATQQRG